MSALLLLAALFMEPVRMVGWRMVLCQHGLSLISESMALHMRGILRYETVTKAKLRRGTMYEHTRVRHYLPRGQ